MTDIQGNGEPTQAPPPQFVSRRARLAAQGLGAIPSVEQPTPLTSSPSEAPPARPPAIPAASMWPVAPSGAAASQVSTAPPAAPTYVADQQGSGSTWPIAPPPSVPPVPPVGSGTTMPPVRPAAVNRPLAPTPQVYPPTPSPSRPISTIGDSDGAPKRVSALGASAGAAPARVSAVAPVAAPLPSSVVPEPVSVRPVVTPPVSQPPPSSSVPPPPSSSSQEAADFRMPQWAPLNSVTPPNNQMQPQGVSPVMYAVEPDPEPEPKKKVPWVGITITVALFALVAIVGYNVWGGVREWFGRTTEVAGVADYPGPGDEPVMVTIPAGASGTMMGELLYEAGVVASSEAFRNAFRDNPRASSIQPGTYELQLHMSAAQAVASMLENGAISLRLVIPEGFTAAQVYARIESVTGITPEEIAEALADPGALGLPEQADGNPEGWLFPATYQVSPGESATSILRTMVARTRQELSSQGADPEDWERVLNMASLVEREVRDPDDRPKVARAILNRIDRGMPLQIDAAVAYGLGISGTQLTLAHLADPANPFNTYQHTGLPPAPIANPGAAAIAAVLHPADGDWIFWVTVNLATGETIFTDTYADHQRYVAQLREWQAANPGFGQQSAAGEHQTD
ncbi:MAG: endolytic transglycosylase MltG [Promicromonosporaceae bacterium]|nr:endolytic transglycosylase MltG [Promicromonosporaceae bacterium]